MIQGGFLLLGASFIIPVRAQSVPDKELVEQILEQAETTYRVSTDLLNGEKYYYPYRSATGTPFFQVPGDPEASVKISGKNYEGQRIRYDMYNQIMVLDYIDVAGAMGSLIIQNEWIDEVSIDGYRFKVFIDKEGKERFGQVIGEGKFVCIYFWEKQYLPDMHNGEQHYFFTEPTRKSFLLYGEERCPYKGNKSLVKCFPEILRPEVKEYLRANHIRVKKATDQQIEGILAMVNRQKEND